MKKYLLFVSLLVVILFTSCKMGVEKKDNGVKTGVISLSLKSDKTGSYSNLSRTVGPVDWELSKVEKWSVKFTSSDYTVTKEFNDTSIELTLPVGTYTIEVEGTVAADEANNIPAYVLYGKVTSVVLTTSGAAPTIPVSLKKTTDGTGNFNYSITLSNFTPGATAAVNETVDTIDYTTFGKYKFKSYLTSVKDSTDKTKLAITGDFKEGFVFLSISANDVKSGFYYLTIEYSYNESNYVVPLPDALVEIADDHTTKATIKDSDFAGVKVRNIYVENNEESNYNGLIPDYKADFNNTIKWLDDNQGAWTTANLYFVKSESEVSDFYDILKCISPYYDVSVNPTSDSSTDAGYKKVVNVYINEELNYALENGAINIPSNCADKISICLKSDEKTELPTTIYNNADLSAKELELFLDNTTAKIRNVNTNNPKLIIETPETDGIKAGYSSSSLIVTLCPDTGITLSDQEIKLYTIKYDSSAEIHYRDIDRSEKNYIILSKTESDGALCCYSALAEETSVTIAAAIPEFEIRGNNAIDIENLNLSYTCYPNDSEDNPLAGDYTFEWFLNGNKLETDATKPKYSLNLNPTINKYLKIGDNNLLVVVSTADGEYRSVNKTIKVYDYLAYKQKAIKFNTTDYGGWSTDYENVPSNNYPEEYPTYSYDHLISFCYDKYGNLYTSLYSNACGSYVSEQGDKCYRIDKYPYDKSISDYSTPVTLWKSTADDENGGAIRMASDGSYVYFRKSTSKYDLRFTTHDYSTVNTLFYVPTETPEDPTSVTPKTVSFSSDFNDFTAIAIKNDTLFVGGSIYNGKTDVTKVGADGVTETGSVNRYTYGVYTYIIKSDGSINTDSKTDYVVYKDSDFVEAFELDNLRTYDVTSAGEDYKWSDKIVSLNCVVSDISTYCGKVYILFSYEAQNEFSRYDSSSGDSYGVESKKEIGGVVFYKENGETKAIKISGERTTDGCNGEEHNHTVDLAPDHTADLAPTRFIAIEPKKLWLSNGDCSNHALYETVDLDTEETTLCAYGYGYYFDSCFDGSGNFLDNLVPISYQNNDAAGAERK